MGHPRRLAFALIASWSMVACATADEHTSSGSDTTGVDTQRTAPNDTGPADTETTAAASGDELERASAAMTAYLDTYVATNNLNGAGLVLVDRDDGIIGEFYNGVFGPERVSLIASSSKMITATIVIDLAAQGVLDLDQPIADQVDWSSDDGQVANPLITPAHLIAGQSGLVGLGPNPLYGPYLCQFLPDGTLEACGETIFETPEDDNRIVAPGTEFRYGGGQWQVAGAVAVATSGRPWADLVTDLNERCATPSLGYANHWSQFDVGFIYPEAFDGDPASLTPTENPSMEGGAYVTAPDYARLLLMHLRGGTCDNGSVATPELIDRAHEDMIDAGSALRGYGFGWWVDRSTGRRQDDGAFGSFPWLDLENGWGGYLVIESDGSAPPDDTFFELTERYFTANDAT